MNIEALQGLGAQDDVPGLQPPMRPAPSAAGPSFGARVSEALHGLNDQLMTSQVDLQRLATGDTSNLHDTMIRLEEGRIGLQLMLQVRNRVLEAYQDVMRMQV